METAETGGPVEVGETGGPVEAGETAEAGETVEASGCRASGGAVDSDDMSANVSQVALAGWARG